MFYVFWETDTSVPVGKIKVWDEVLIDPPQTFYDFWDVIAAHAPRGRIKLRGEQTTLEAIFKTFGWKSMLAKTV